MLIYTSGVSAHFFKVLPVTTLLKARGEPGKETILLYDYSSFVIQQLKYGRYWRNIPIPKKTTKPLCFTEPCLNLFSFSDSQLLFTFCTTKLIMSQTLAISATLRVWLNVSRLDENNFPQAKDDTYVKKKPRKPA